LGLEGCRGSAPRHFFLKGGSLMNIEGMLLKRLSTDLSLLPPRMALGGAMIYHGAGKLRGPGLEQTGQFFESIGLKPGRPLARATGLAETISGVMSILGVGTRIAALAVLVTQAVAVRKVHLAKGFDIMKGGYEYNLALMAMALGLLIRGPGRVSVHEGIEKLVERQSRRHWRLPTRKGSLMRAVKLVK
jgi:putative oxidoreductase